MLSFFLENVPYIDILGEWDNVPATARLGEQPLPCLMSQRWPKSSSIMTMGIAITGDAKVNSSTHNNFVNIWLHAPSDTAGLRYDGVFANFTL